MNLTVRDSNRWCSVELDEEPSVEKMRQALLREEGTVSGFSILTAPAPAHDDTVLKVCGNQDEILVGVALLDSARTPSSPGEADSETVEILFDTLDDRIGYVQFIFACGGREPDAAVNPHRDPEPVDEVQVISHQPYPEAHSSSHTVLTLKRHEWRDEQFSPGPITPLRCRMLFAWFRPEEVFRTGITCGFNVCRNRPALDEFSSWNYCAGNGAQDATSFGRLYLFESPTQVRDVEARLEGSNLHLEGVVSPESGELSLQLADPTGGVKSVPIAQDGDRWQGTVQLNPGSGGRYRIYPSCGDEPAEPTYFSVDVPSESRPRDFCLSVTYDPPMSIIANYYTPERLRGDMEVWSSLGVRRIHWIDYGEWPSFWNYHGHGWWQNYPKTIEACGDLLSRAVEAAHDQGLDFIADLKTFDLGINCFFAEDDGVSTVEDLEERHVPVIPEIAAHQEWTMPAYDGWLRKPRFPVTRLRLYSEAPIPELDASGVKLLTSGDNRVYRPYDGPLHFKQGSLKRGHLRWTPAGNIRENGTRENWYVEFSGMLLREPYLAIKLGEKSLSLRHRGFMVAEAWNRSGERAPLTLATNGSSAEGFFYWKGWPGWTNQTEPILQNRSWDGRDLGLVFREMPNMPTMLDPSLEGARGIWLARLEKALDSGADGVDIRTYCHHNGHESYLKYTLAKPVLRAFRRATGRPPRTTHEDYQLIRALRGGFYTDFIREARELTSSRDKKLIVELESGVEIPPEYDCRMQLPIGWRQWLEEGLVDELRLKWWTAESRFIHEEVLPLAHKSGVPVHITSRCLHEGFGLRAAEMAEKVIGGACAAGFSGYSFYEHQNLMDMNTEGRSTLKGPTRAYFGKAQEVLGR